MNAVKHAVFRANCKDATAKATHMTSTFSNHLLGPGKYNMNPKEAYLAGAKRTFRPSFTAEEPPEAAVAVPFQVFVLQ